jgi:hypothetical protein
MTIRRRFFAFFAAALSVGAPPLVTKADGVAPSHYSANAAMTEFTFGGPPYCYYHASLHLDRLVMDVGAQQTIPSGEAQVTLNEDASLCPFKPLGTKTLKFKLINGEFTGYGCVLTFNPSPGNEPRTTASFVGQFSSSGCRGTLTLTRVDSAPILNWTAQLSTLLQRS